MDGFFFPSFFLTIFWAWQHVWYDRRKQSYCKASVAGQVQ
jgi:hypothetical protein